MKSVFNDDVCEREKMFSIIGSVIINDGMNTYFEAIGKDLLVNIEGEEMGRILIMKVMDQRYNIQLDRDYTDLKYFRVLSSISNEGDN